jgi:hypothetical protein
MNIIKNIPLAKQPRKDLRNPCFIVATHTEAVTNSKSLLSGDEVATGKSKLVHNITLFTTIFDGKWEEYFGAVIKTVPTECAAHNIRGYTWQSALSITPLVEHRSLLVAVECTTN